MKRQRFPKKIFAVIIVKKKLPVVLTSFDERLSSSNYKGEVVLLPLLAMFR